MKSSAIVAIALLILAGLCILAITGYNRDGSLRTEQTSSTLQAKSQQQPVEVKKPASAVADSRRMSEKPEDKNQPRKRLVSEQDLTLARWLKVGQRRFGKLDRNEDGTIAAGELGPKRQKRFHKLDENGDGVITIEEWNVILEKRFNAADANGDKVLSLDEFKTVQESRKHAPD